jgi:DNA mismatch repair ATPase MutL
MLFKNVYQIHKKYIVSIKSGMLLLINNERIDKRVLYEQF